MLVDEVFKEGAGGQRVSDEVLWLLTDHQGTVRNVVDEYKTLRRHVDYDAFGYVLNISWFGKNGEPISPLEPEAVDQLFYYTGQERDDATGLQLHGARWYDPATARWLSEDPSGFDGGTCNLYEHVNEMPINKIILPDRFRERGKVSLKRTVRGGGLNSSPKQQTITPMW
jgi:RHS repeat-associated protein